MSKKKITLDGLKQKFCANAKDLGRCFDKIIADEDIVSLLNQSPIIHRELSAMNVYVGYFLMMKNTLVKDNKSLDKYRTHAFESKPKEGQPNYQFLIDVFCDLCHATSTIGIGLVGRMANDMAMNQTGTVKFYDFPGHVAFKGHELRAVVAAEVIRLNETNEDEDAIVSNRESSEDAPEQKFKPDVIVDIFAKFSKKFKSSPVQIEKIKESIYAQLDGKENSSFKEKFKGKLIGLRFFFESRSDIIQQFAESIKLDFLEIGETKIMVPAIDELEKLKGDHIVVVSDNAPIKKSLEAKISKLNQSN